jgi:hypothetical protein
MGRKRQSCRTIPTSETRQWSPDSNRLAYVREDHSTGAMQVMEWSSRSRNEEPLAPPSDAEPKEFDWSSRSNSLLISQWNEGTGRSEIAVLPVVDKPRADAVPRSLFSDAAYDLYQARFSPDERWIVFEALPRVRTDPLHPQSMCPAHPAAHGFVSPTATAGTTSLTGLPTGR